MAERTRFNLESYPKSYASTKAGDYRLKEFLDLDEVDLEKLNDELFGCTPEKTCASLYSAENLKSESIIFGKV